MWCLAQDVIYTSRTYATMSVSVCLSVTEVNWRSIANLGFKFRSKFTAHCRRGEGSSQQQHISRYASHCYALLLSYASGQTDIDEQGGTLIAIFRILPGSDAKI